MRWVQPRCPMDGFDQAAMSAVPESIAGRYRLLATLGAGGMGMVYEALDRLTGERVALKRVVAPTSQLWFNTLPDANQDLRLALTQEFRTLAVLRHPHIIPVLDYGFSAAGQPFFTMSLVSGAHDIIAAADGESFDTKMDYFFQMLRALAYLHRRGILHRDLKPANVLVDQNDQVRVLDFGLAVRGETASDGMGGTVSYLAPEILDYYPTSRASDIYAAGVMMYELLVGTHPFDTDNPSTMVQAIVEGRVNWLAFATATQAYIQPEAPYTLTSIAQKMMTPNPQQRYRNVDLVIHDLCAALGRPVPVETQAEREGYLQAATFCGRDAELAQLTNALAQILPQRQNPAFVGSAWLVGGESGVGKSRLLEELRVRALIEGALVVRGQAEAGVRLPFQLFQNVLRRLVLSTSIRPEEAALLKLLLPDIADLLGQPVRDFTGGGAEAHAKLIQTILALFARQTRPVVVLLEDLQWARGSLEILRPLVEQIAHLPIVLVATFRDNEWPELPAQLAEMQLIHLTAFNLNQVKELSHAILAMPEEYPQLAEFLYKETKGNAFFVVEAVRSLAEDAGSLFDVGTVTLPQWVLQGGMDAIIAQRLKRVPADYHPLLKMAAVFGRALDESLLHHLAPSALDWEAWLTAGVNARVLESYEGGWRFTHDKLREHLLRSTPAEELAQLHQTAARAIEATYVAETQTTYAATLAEHWRIAGDLYQQHRYTAMAARYLNMRGYRAEASVHFQGAEFIFKHLGDALDDEARRVQMTTNISAAVAALQLSKLDAAAASLRWAQQLATQVGADKDRLRIDYYHWYMVMQSGCFEKAEKGFQANLAWAERINDPDAIIRALDGLSTVQRYRNQPQLSRENLERAIEMNRPLGSPYGTAYLQINLAYTLQALGDYPAAAQYFNQGLATCQSQGYKGEVVWALLGLARLAIRQAGWTVAEYYAREGLVVAVEIADKVLCLTALVTMARSWVARGQISPAAQLIGLAHYFPYGIDLDLKTVEHDLTLAVQTAVNHPHVVDLMECGRGLDLMQVVHDVLERRWP